MSSPLALFDSLRDIYFRYLDSPFDLRYSDLIAERRGLCDVDGRIYRRPLIEPVPAYQSCGQTFKELAESLLGTLWTPAEISDLVSFVSLGLFPPDWELYVHQREVFEEVVVHGLDVVVTTGTGSGKTECFLLPIVAALIRESASWGPPNARSLQWDWWNHSTLQGARRRWAPRVSQREHEDRATRPAAIRALILYPLNALVEDQLGRLRAGLDSADVHLWFQSRRRGNRFYFGRYTGRTPISGNRGGAATARLRDELQSMHQDAQLVAGSSAAPFFPSMDGGEMWSRWDMQDSPPDILITNYSMLNIMLMRAIESPIFDQTRQWLEEDSSRVFHLVVDELHSYRGTPGTEVAYLLRVLLDRLGLAPASDQLRIIASSASVTGGPAGLAYLQSFFGRDRSRFSVVRGAVMPPDLAGLESVRRHAVALRTLREGLSTQIPESRTVAATAFHMAVGAPPPSNQERVELVLDSAMRHIRAADALRLACATPGNTGQLRPRFPEAIAEAIFQDLAPSERMEALDGMLSGLAVARGPSNTAPLPLRVHIFFRNLQGLWICTNPACNRAPTRSETVPAGALHYVPVLTCQCGSRVIELLYCEACGEVFFGGYRRETGNPNEWYLSPDHPDLEASPDMASMDRDYLSYAVYWPRGDGPTPISAQWIQDGVRRTWRPASFSSTDGRVGLGGGPGYLYYVPDMHRQNPPAVESARRAYPARCPRCDADWSRRQIGSPVRTLRTGFQKIAQVLSDMLLRQMAGIVPGTARKLVVFSDSRQDAAKLSAGMRFSHYRDALRQALCREIATQGAGALAFSAQLRGENLSTEGEALANAFANTYPAEAATLSMAANPLTALRPAPGNPGLSCQQVAQQILSRATNGPFQVTQLAAGASAQLLARGMNPGGYSQEVLWTDPRNRSGSWKDLYNWPVGSLPTSKSPADLTGAPGDHLRRIQELALIEVMDIIFASGRRSLESLRLAFATTDRIRSPAPNALIQEAADGVIRLLGARRRLSTHSPVEQNNPPAYALSYLGAVADQHGLARGAFANEVLAYLSGAGCLTRNAHVLIVGSLCLMRPGASFFECPQCRRIHLHLAGGICTDCEIPLGPPQPVNGPQNPGDYYGYLATQAGPLFRLNCEELTGQTNKRDARRRQRLFQDISLPAPAEIALADAVDLLSVTTTMEAGVDIGGLSSVMMANMPPMRFNYQQRVGRAGRRFAGLSVALTLCRGRSHDDYYFQRPDRITSDPPPQPYVDMRRPAILRRVLAKEVLRQAFAALGLFVGQGGDNVHGEFGDADSWNRPPAQPLVGAAPGATVAELVAGWIQNNRAAIEHVCDVLLSYTSGELQANRSQLIDHVQNELIARVTGVSLDTLLPQQSLSKRLANVGVLPMFGFPTRARYLFHEQPTAGNEWPPDGVVDRDLDIAISQFAPCAETVKDGIIHTSVGVVDYQPIGNAVREVPDPLGPPIPIGLCRRCQAVDETPGVSCPVCGADQQHDPGYRVIQLAQPKGFRTWYWTSRDFDGVFEWTPRASRPKVGVTPRSMTSVRNFEIWCGEETVYVVNDNDGRLFIFEKLAQRETWVTREAMAKLGVVNPPLTPGGMVDTRALGSVKPTDVLTLGIGAWPVGINADPRKVDVRAALYSLGFLLRRAGAVRLDIDARELRVGLRVLPDPNGRIIGQIFMSDSLENGAGYSSFFGTPAEAESLLRFIVGDSDPAFYAFLVSPAHANECQTSCPDCLRDFSNLNYHNILDWRLGLDLARLALDPAVSIDFTVSYWQELAAAVTNPYFAAIGREAITYGGLPAGRRNTSLEIITHPLWNTDPNYFGGRLARAYAQAVAEGLEVRFKSLFEVLRRPY